VIEYLQCQRQAGRSSTNDEHIDASTCHGRRFSAPVSRHHSRPEVTAGSTRAGIGEVLVAAKSRQNPVGNKARDADQREDPPQRADVIVGQRSAVLLIQAAVVAIRVVRDPQLRDEPWKADEQRGAELEDQRHRRIRSG
jgi:hypothetical protein